MDKHALGITNRFDILTKVDLNSVWETIKGEIKDDKTTKVQWFEKK